MVARKEVCRGSLGVASGKRLAPESGLYLSLLNELSKLPEVSSGNPLVPSQGKLLASLRDHIKVN